MVARWASLVSSPTLGTMRPSAVTHSPCSVDTAALMGSSSAVSLRRSSSLRTKPMPFLFLSASSFLSFNFEWFFSRILVDSGHLETLKLLIVFRENTNSYKIGGSGIEEKIDPNIDPNR